MGGNPFLGTWKLRSFEVRSIHGEVSYPWGTDPVGCLMYTEDYMSVSMMAAHRPVFSARDLPRGTVEEKVAAADKYISYAGTYEIRGNKVIHHVEVSLFPNWVGGDQERYFTFDGDTLILSTDPAPGDEKQKTGHLVWKRA